MGVRTEMKGFAQRIAKAATRDRMVPATIRAAEEMKAIACSHTPREGGALRESWHVCNVQRTKRGAKAEVENSAGYASFVEHGHRQQRGRFVPALGRTLVQGFVPGRFFMRTAQREYLRKRDGAVKKMMERELRQVFGDD